MTTLQLDRVTFEQLFKTHFESLCYLAQQYVSDVDTAQDICQKVFIRVWERREQMDLNQNVEGYLAVSVKRLCLNHIRDHKKFRSQVLDVDVELENLTETPVDPFAATDLQQKIEEALSQLPPKCRRVFEMSRYEGKKYKEIAEELDVSVKTVEAHITKAMKLLRVALKAYLTVVILMATVFLLG